MPIVCLDYIPAGVEKKSHVLDFYVDQWYGDIAVSQELGDPYYFAEKNLFDSDVFVISDTVSKIIALRTFSIKKTRLGVVIVHPNYRQFGIAKFATLYAIDKILEQNGGGKISFEIATYLGGKLMSSVQKDIGKGILIDKI